MSVNSVSSLVSSCAKQVTSGSTGGAPKTNAVAAAIQEATESQTTTLKEAQNGDPIARKKLLKQQQAAQQQKAVHTKASEPGKGGAVDHDA